MKSGVYKITCQSTGKIYVGSSKNIKRRFQSHLADLKRGKHGNPYMKNSYQKYGKENFELEILELCDCQSLLEREYFWIENLNSKDPKIGFNIIFDSIREGLKNEKCNNQEYRKKQCEISKKRWQDPKFAMKNLEAIRKSHQERKDRGEILACNTEEAKKKAYQSCHAPEFLKGLSERTLKQLENPEYRELALKNLEKGRNSEIAKDKLKKFIEYQKTNEYKKIISEKLKISHAKRKKEKWIKKREQSDCYENISKGLKEYFSTEEGKNQCKDLAKKRWANPETRKKYIEGMIKRRQDPEYRKQCSEKAKAQWAERKKICSTL